MHNDNYITAGIIIGALLATLLWIPMDSEYIDPEVSYTAKETCKNNGGVNSIEVDDGISWSYSKHGTTTYDIVCNNGAVFDDIAGTVSEETEL